VTEWCKKEACWERVRAAPVTLPRGLGEELLTAALVRDRAEAVITPALRMVSDLEEETWQQMLGWISETTSLEGWHRAIAFQLRQLKRQGRSMSHKQLEQGLQVVLAARDGGFRPAQEPLWDTVTTIQEPEADADELAVPMSDSE
jgi:hypothetical protein